MAQGLTLSAGSGSLEFLEDGAWNKRFHPGWAAVSGITAAALARQGFVGAKRAYEGRFGLYASHLQSHFDPANLALATAGLGEIWELLQVAVKPYPACHFVHACVDAAVTLDARAQARCRSEIEQVRALVPAEVVKTVCEPAANKRRPANSYDAQFSIPYTVAAALRRGQFTLDELEDDALGDADILALADRVKYEIDPATTFPRHYTGEVIVTLRGGRTLRHREAVNRGNGERPLSEADDHREIPFERGARRLARQSAGGSRRCCFRSTKRPTSAPSPTALPAHEEVALSTVTREAPPQDDEAENVILASIDRFLERDVAPYAHKLEHDDIYPEEIVARMKELGLFGATIDTAYGGLGLSTTVYARIVERISRVWMSVTGIFNSHLIMAAAVQRFGTEAQKQAYLPRFATGELRGGLALTEPDCGTDLQAIRTVARRRGDSYVVNGTKTWISNGIHGQCFALLVKTDPEAEPRHKGMSLFIAEKGDGFKVSRKLEKLGYKGIDSAELVFEDYVIPADRLIGGQEGLGLKHALGGLELGRINVAARGVGLAQAALDQALAYSQVRKTFGKPICQHQAIQLKLADMATQIHAARLLTARRGAGPTTAGCAATWKPAWRNCSPPKRR